MKGDNYSYEVEAYYLMTQADRSILLLNPIIEKFGYSFRIVGIEELERNFSDLVALKAPYNPRGFVNITSLNVSVSNQFYETMERHALFGPVFLMHVYVILLYRLKNYTRVVVNGRVDIADTTGAAAEMQSFCKALVTQVRLVKNCNLDSLLQFHVAQGTRTVVMRLEGPFRKGVSIAEMNFTANEVEEFGELFQGVAEPNELSTLAFQNFMLTHDIADSRVEFMLLMSALESIFNLGADQIAHTVSRHLALIVSATKAEFEEHYRVIKKLYGTRSKIVHGEAIKIDLTGEVLQLKTYVRKALLFSLKCKLSKKELFSFLNASGFAE